MRFNKCIQIFFRNPIIPTHPDSHEHFISDIAVHSQHIEL